MRLVDYVDSRAIKRDIAQRHRRWLLTWKSIGREYALRCLAGLKPGARKHRRLAERLVEVMP